MSTFVVVQLFWVSLLNSKSVNIQHIVPANKLVDHVPLKQMHL